MDPASYYAKHGPVKHKSPRSDSAKSGTSATKDALQDECADESSASTAAPPIRTHDEPTGDDATSSDDVEEDDSREIPTEELATFVRQLRSFCNSSAGKERALEFNKTNPVECERCVKQNIACKHSQTTLRCDCCSVVHQSCSRTNVFYTWMVRLTFKLSWTKAEEALKRGQASLPTLGPRGRTSGRASGQYIQPSWSARVYNLLIVARVRKAPASAPVFVAKRPQLSGPPRADRKRRTDVPESKSEPHKRRKVLEPEMGREILPPPTSSSASTPEATIREPKHVVGRDLMHAFFDTRPDAPDILAARLAARVTAAEERLDAIETRLRMPIDRATRLSVVTELDRTIIELEIGGGVQGAIQRLRALHGSLLNGEQTESTI